MRRSSCAIHFRYRYSAKAQSPDKLMRTSLAGREMIAANRVYAIENSPRGLALAHVAKAPLILMRSAWLTAVRTSSMKLPMYLLHTLRTTKCARSPTVAAVNSSQRFLLEVAARSLASTATAGRPGYIPDRKFRHSNELIVAS